MNKINCSNINFNNSSLSDQIFIIITQIITTYYQDKDIIIFNSFLDTNKYIPISEIINIDRFGDYIYEKYNIKIFDKHNFSYKIKSIKYGSRDKVDDITTNILNLYYKDGKLNITKNDLLTSTDPIYYFSKKVNIQYSINNNNFQTNYSEYFNKPTENIIIDFSEDKFVLPKNSFLPNTINLDMAILLLKQLYISFNSEYYQKVTEFMNFNKLNNQKINVLNYNDDIKYWADINKIDIKVFEQIIVDKYINIIKDNLDSNDMIILISNYNNKIIDFLENNNYKYIFTNKDETILINGIIDLIIGGKCNNIFIGDNNPSFSYILSKNLDKNIKQILVDYNNI
jgi:hypothetical protein